MNLIRAIFICAPLSVVFSCRRNQSWRMCHRHLLHPRGFVVCVERSLLCSEVLNLPQVGHIAEAVVEETVLCSLVWSRVGAVPPLINGLNTLDVTTCSSVDNAGAMLGAPMPLSRSKPAYRSWPAGMGRRTDFATFGDGGMASSSSASERGSEPCGSRPARLPIITSCIILWAFALRSASRATT